MPVLRPQRLHKNLPENIRAKVNSEDLRGLNYLDPYSLAQLRGIPGDGPVLPKIITSPHMLVLSPAILAEAGRVLHSVQKIEALRQRDSELNRSIHSLIDSLNG